MCMIEDLFSSSIQGVLFPIMDNTRHFYEVMRGIVYETTFGSGCIHTTDAEIDFVLAVFGRAFETHHPGTDDNGIASVAGRIAKSHVTILDAAYGATK